MPFASSAVINQQIESSSLRVFFVGYDLGLYRLEPFTEFVLDTLVDFAFGYHTGILEKQYDRRLLKEAAKSIYKIKEYAEVKGVYVDENGHLSDCELTAENKYLKKGEFGEMILHLILRDFFDTVPLLSKIHFKDTDNAVVHGFDIVHIGPDPNDNTLESLYFGESKLYSRKDGQAGIHGVNDLIEDVKKHFKTDFLYREFALINKKKDAFKSLSDYDDLNTKEKYAEFLVRKKYWYSELNQVESGKKKLEELFKSVTIPLVCTYESKIFENITDENSQLFKSELDSEIKILKERFTTLLNNIKQETGELVRTELNILLILFPIPSKKLLVKTLHEKLFKYQG